MEITTVLWVLESYEYEILLKVYVRVLKKRQPGKLHFTFFFSPKKLVRLFILKGVKPSSDGTMMKLVIFDNLLQPLRHFR